MEKNRMNKPRVEIFLDENSNLCLTKVEHTGAEPKMILDIELADLLQESPTEAAYRLGGTVLNLMRLWHREEFGEWQVPPPKSGK
jgi:hypothetical protein